MFKNNTMIHLTICKYIFVANRECNCSYILLTYGLMAHSDMYIQLIDMNRLYTQMMLQFTSHVNIFKM